jgi:hypothetical protein
LLTPERLDLAIKWRMFRHLIAGGDAEAEAVYRAHILARTGGVEPGSWKASVEHYVAACGGLLASMQADGFDAARPVVIGSNGRLRAGAHRIGCAVAIGLPVGVRRVPQPGRARPWDAAYLAAGGLPRAAIERAEQDTAGLTHGEDCGCHRPKRG